MKKIISVLQPFVREQTFYIYEDGNLIAEKSDRIENIDKAIFSLSEEYKVDKVELAGPKQYNRGLKRKIQEVEMSKYNYNKLEINIL